MEPDHGKCAGARLVALQDEEIVNLAKSGHMAAAELLISRYRPLVETKAKAYFVAGADRDDVIQEGMIGLCKAIRDFRGDRVNKFRTFAELCVTRQIITAVKSATRQKHTPLNRYVSLDSSLSDDPLDPCASGVAMRLASSDSRQGSIQEGFLPKDFRESVHHILSDLECGVLRCYLGGMSYSEMSDELDCRTKSIDNALQRVKRKIGVLLKS